MPLTFLRDAAAWLAMAEDWNALLARSALDLPFLRSEFLQSWWATKGGGEWPDGDLRVAVHQDDRGVLLAAAPLFVTSSHPASLLLLGTSEIADYLDVLCPRDELGGFAASLLESIETSAVVGIEALDLWNVLETSPTLAAFEAEARGRGWRCERSRLRPAPVIPLTGGWEGYLSRLEKKQRHELRRKMRRAAAYPEGISFTRAQRGPGLRAAVDDLLRLMASDPEKDSFLSESMRAMFHALAEGASDAGWLRLEFLHLGGRPAAAYLCFDFGNRLWIYNSGLDPEFQSLSPGWALLGNLIQASAEEGKEAVDLLRGDEEYKIRLGGVVRHVVRLKMTRP